MHCWNATNGPLSEAHQDAVGRSEDRTAAGDKHNQEGQKEADVDHFTWEIVLSYCSEES